MNIMSWNLKQGGFSSHEAPETVPERELDISAVIDDAKATHSVSTLVLPDAHLWDETYGGDDGIARHVGFAAARFVRLDDARLNQDAGIGIGVALATDEPVDSWNVLDLGSRQAISTVLNIGAHGLQVAGVYLDDLKEENRRSQLRALHAEIVADIPTVLIGDFNMLRPNLRGASLRDRMANLAIHGVAPLYPGYHGKAIRDMNKRSVYDEAIKHGFVDADPKKRPTLPAIPVFGIDYAFVRGAEVISFNVLSAREASDHLPIVVEVEAA